MPTDKKRSKTSFINKINNSTKNKTFLILYSLILVICFVVIFSIVFSYNKMFNNFIVHFDKGEYIQATNIILNKDKLNPVKHLLLKSDMKKYFSTKLNSLNEDHKNNKISDLNLLAIISEIERFNVINDDITKFKDNLDVLKDSEVTFNNGVKRFNDKDYIGAFNSFAKVLPYDDNYIESLNYNQNISNILKDNALKSAEELASQKYYSKAITLLEENMQYYGNDKNILSKIDEYKSKKDELLNKNNSKDKKDSSKDNSKEVNKSSNKEANTSKETSKETSTTTVRINENNINSLNIHSDSPYLMYVDLQNQRTHIYKGSKNKWQLLKDFVCSTGVSGKETPKGTYTTKSKGDWFYAPEYKQGGKYWVTFMDRYMFHSIPFDKDKKTIVDETLGIPASHGCIRLAINDAKWIHDNVTIGSKLIIN